MSILGAGTALCAAIETTWGTAVTPATNCREVKSLGFRADFGRVQSGRIRSGFFGGDIEAYEDANGTSVLEVTYENLGLWFQEMLWSTPSTTGAGPYTHVYDGGTTQPVGLTVHAVLGDSGQGRQMVGALVSTWELAISVGDPQLILSLGWIGKQVTTITAVTPSFGSGDEGVSGLDAAKLSYNGNTYCLRALTIRGSNGLEARRCLGESTTAKPVPTGARTVEVEFELDYDANVETEHAAKTEATASMTFTGSGNNAMTLTMRNMLILSISDPINNAGVVTQRVRARCRENPSGTYPFQISVTNDNASAIAN